MQTAADRIDPNAITPEGHERLRSELRFLTEHRRDEVASWLRECREDGGAPGSNAGLAQALEEHDRLEARIAELEATLAKARVVDPAGDGSACVGSRVRLRAPGTTAVAYQLVGPLEADARRGTVSVSSPVGRALLGCRAGDTVSVDTPGGVRSIELLAVDAPDASARAAA